MRGGRWGRGISLFVTRPKKLHRLPDRLSLLGIMGDQSMARYYTALMFEEFQGDPMTLRGANPSGGCTTDRCSYSSLSMQEFFL